MAAAVLLGGPIRTREAAKTTHGLSGADCQSVRMRRAPCQTRDLGYKKVYDN
eukprot:COSAG06_NODE_26043_length_623_cov_0.753817_1_plen_51_part_10